MNQELQNIINQSSFIILPGEYIYAKVNSVQKYNKHFMVARDHDEITVVTKKENQIQLDLIERNKDDYILIALNVSIPFYSVGFLAAVSGVIAQAGMDILIVSTYSKDYIMVKADLKNKAEKVLIDLGFK